MYYRNLQLQTNGIISDGRLGIPSSFPFWCGHYLDPNDKNRVIQDGEPCCYNHWLGLPNRWDRRHPMYQYEVDLAEDMKRHRKIFVEKAAGLGITEFVLRWLEWMAMTSAEFQNAQVALISGPNRNLAKDLIARMTGPKEVNNDFHDLGTKGIAYDITDYGFKIGTVRFDAMPSDNIDAVRSMPNPKAFFIDEAAFFLMQASKEIQVRQAIEHYDLKSKPWIIWVSTPGYLPEGVFYQIKTEEPSKYRKISLDYREGLVTHPESFTTIYPVEMVDEAKKSPAFAREYMLIWGGGQGNIFHWKLVDEVTEEYDLRLGNGQKGLYVDPAYGTSKFAILGLEKINGIIYVKEALQFDRPDPTAMIDLISQKAPSYSNRIKVDSARPEIVTGLAGKNIRAQEVPFNKELSNMTAKAAEAVKNKKVRIHPVFHDLISQLKAAEFNEKGHPDKKKLTFDLGDTFLMGVDDLTISSEGHVLGGIPRSSFQDNSRGSFLSGRQHPNILDYDLGNSGGLF
ncbi:MAG: hypothetical protein KGI33_01230 [Thaumarchaeota archaeon]|nr:hypothetical protein [Nitrososphaerota archaeon]